MEDAQAAQPAAGKPQQLAFPFYRVNLDVFEGPLDLLLHLIKKNEVEIRDIPVAAITEQYLAYIEVMRDLNLDVAGEFLVMAATLTLIKSRMLLPTSEDEEPEEDDPRAQLVQQLLEYQRFREAAMELSERPLLHRDVFIREPLNDDPEWDTAAESPRLNINVWELLEAFRGVLARAHPDVVHAVVTEPISLRDRARALLDALRAARLLDFNAVFATDATRVEIIVTFLALLELVKLGAIRATQDEHFGRIVIELAVEDPDAVSFSGIDEYDHSPVGETADDGNRPEPGNGTDH